MRNLKLLIVGLYAGMNIIIALFLKFKITSHPETFAAQDLRKKKLDADKVTTINRTITNERGGREELSLGN